MCSRQRAVLASGSVLLLAVALFPPWVEVYGNGVTIAAGHAFLGDTRTPGGRTPELQGYRPWAEAWAGNRINTPLLVVYLATIALATATFYALTATPRDASTH